MGFPSRLGRAFYGILRNLIEIVVLLCLLCLLCFQNLLCLRSQILKRVILFGYYRISAMQINGSFQIVTFVTSVIPTFLSCIALLILYFCCSFACFVLAVRLRWGISPLRRRPRALPFGFPQAFEKA